MYVVNVQLQYSCERHLSQLDAMTDNGDSLSKCLTLIAELKDFEKRSKVRCYLKLTYYYMQLLTSLVLYVELFYCLLYISYQPIISVS